MSFKTFAAYTAEVSAWTLAGGIAGAFMGGPVGAAGGMLYGATVSLVRKPTAALCEHILKPKNEFEKMCCTMVKIIAVSAVAFCAVSIAFALAGIPITASTFTLLCLGITGVFVGGAAAVAAAVAGAALAALAAFVIVSAVVYGIAYACGSAETREKMRSPIKSFKELMEKARLEAEAEEAKAKSEASEAAAKECGASQPA